MFLRSRTGYIYTANDGIRDSVKLSGLIVLKGVSIGLFLP